MSDHLSEARDYHAAIREILMREWDPIGVAGIPKAQDEYDSYIGDIYAILIRRESVQRLVDYLWWAETEHMSLFGNRSRTEQVAQRIAELPSTLG